VLTRFAAVAALIALAAPFSVALGDDPEFQPPPNVKSHILLLAPPREPGRRMVVTARLIAPEGKTPRERPHIGAHQTDALGNYGRDPRVPDWARLNGWLRTDSAGRYEIRTIRPGAYPQRNTPAHIHFVVETSNGVFDGTMELQFEDDLLVSSTKREASRREGRFGTVRPVRSQRDTLYVERDLRIR